MNIFPEEACLGSVCFSSCSLLVAPLPEVLVSLLPLTQGGGAMIVGSALWPCCVTFRPTASHPSRDMFAMDVHGQLPMNTYPEQTPRCPLHTYTASSSSLASCPRTRESRRRAPWGLDARRRGHDVLLVQDLRNRHLDNVRQCTATGQLTPDPCRARMGPERGAEADEPHSPRRDDVSVCTSRADPGP